MSKPKTPKAPDPYNTAAIDFAFNNPNQVTPWGTLTNTAPTVQNIGTKKQPQYVPTGMGTSTLNLTPEMQQILDNQIQFSTIATDEALRRQPELSNLPDMPVYDPQRYTDAMFAQQRGLLDPVFAQQERSLQDRLANQGLPVTGEAYREDTGNFMEERSRAYERAALDAILSGQQMGAQDLQLGAFQRTVPFNEIASLLGLQQVQVPTLQNFYQPRGSDYTGSQALNSQVQSQNYQAGSGGFSNLMSGLFGLGSSAIGAYGMRGR